MAPKLWHSFGTAAALLQEIINIYPSINPATLTAHQSNRVCNALALLQCVASHPETRSVFLQAQIPLFLYPFLHTTSKTRPFEYLRLTSLGVIGALVKVCNKIYYIYIFNDNRKFFFLFKTIIFLIFGNKNKKNDRKILTHYKRFKKVFLLKLVFVILEIYYRHQNEIKIASLARPIISFAPKKFMFQLKT